MNLVLFLRAWVIASIGLYKDYTKEYQDKLFYLPRIVCTDGWSISLQIHNGNYCSSENGYRQFGFDWKKVEWGFPSAEDELLVESAEDGDNITQTVGSIEIQLISDIIDSHGGIDWEATLAPDKLIKNPKY
jgi:hypothetical protein